MKLIFVLAIVALTAAPVVIGGLKRQESGETENLRFAYDSRTHMLMLLRQATCYIFVLTEDERTAVHTDSGLRTLELKALGQISQPNLNLTTVPKNALHTNILHQCGKGVLQYHIVQ